MHAVPYRLVSDGALNAVRDALARAASSWSDEWGIDAGAVSVSVARAWEAAPDAKAAAPGAQAQSWGRAVRVGERQCWFAFGADLASGLEAIMFGDAPVVSVPPAPANLGPAAACAARDALLDALAGAALSCPHGAEHSAGGEFPASIRRRGTGAVLASITVGCQQCRILLNDAAVQTLQPAPAGLTPLAAVDYTACVSQVPVALQLTVGAARVGLGSLLSLSEGDVIALSTSSDTLATLCTPGGQALLVAYLGRCGDSFAAELVQSSNLCEASHA